MEKNIFEISFFGGDNIPREFFISGRWIFTKYLRRKIVSVSAVDIDIANQPLGEPHVDCVGLYFV